MVCLDATPVPVAWPFARIAFLMVACGCLAGCWGMVPGGLVPDDTRDTMVGMTLSAEEAEALEARLRTSVSRTCRFDTPPEAAPPCTGVPATESLWNDWSSSHAWS